jgi:HEAT repeat protein
MGSRTAARRAQGFRHSSAHLNLMKSKSRAKSFVLSSRARLRSTRAILFLSVFSLFTAFAYAQQPSSSSRYLTPLQLKIEKERQRLTSSDKEERRDAVMRLGWMQRSDSSRAAALALNDPTPIVRATAARAVLWLPANEAVQLLIPLLRDKEEFVRQEAAYALGETRSRAAAPELIGALERDKTPAVRGAAAVALGLIGDETAVVPLTQTFSLRVRASGLLNKIRRRKEPENEFVRRAAASALGQIRSRAAVPALMEALTDERAGDDVRREAARALGLIGDSAAVPALRAVLGSRDAYLARIAYEALLKIAPAEATRLS